MGLEPETGKTAGRREAGRTCADHQGFLLHPDGDVFRILPVLKEGNLHFHLVGSPSGGALGVISVDPGTALAKVDRANRPNVRTLSGEGETDKLHFSVGRAGTEDDLADAVLADQGLTPGRIARQAKGILDGNEIHRGVGFEPRLERLQIDDAAYLAEAGAEDDTDFCHFSSYP